MNFRTATTPEKLRFLAEALRKPRIAKMFDQSTWEDCVVGLGNRLTGGGRILPSKYSDGIDTFAKKFGITETEASAFFVASYGRLRIGVRSRKMHEVTAGYAANILDRLADHYENQNRGNQRSGR